MNKTCPNCKANFEPEPGFYWGAMYITYGMNTGLAIVVSLILYLFFGNPILEVYILVVLAINIILAPLFFRYSRLILLYSMGGLKFKKEHFLNYK